MHSITSTAELRATIRQLEDQRDLQTQLMKDEFSKVVESLKPVNIIKSSVSGITHSHHVLRNIIIAVTGLAVAYFTRRKKKKAKGSPARKLLAMIIQTGIASLLTVKGSDIKEKAYMIFTNLFSKKKEEEQYYRSSQNS